MNFEFKNNASLCLTCISKDAPFLILLIFLCFLLFCFLSVSRLYNVRDGIHCCHIDSENDFKPAGIE